MSWLERAQLHERTGEMSAELDGLLYRWPASVVRRLAYGDLTEEMCDEKYCVDEFVIRARRGVL